MSGLTTVPCGTHVPPPLHQVDRLCAAFPLLPPAVVENAFLAMRHSFKDCARALDDAFPGARAIDDEARKRGLGGKSSDIFAWLLGYLAVLVRCCLARVRRCHHSPLAPARRLTVSFSVVAPPHPRSRSRSRATFCAPDVCGCAPLVMADSRSSAACQEQGST